jgi:hypothetical protein
VSVGIYARWGKDDTLLQKLLAMKHVGVLHGGVQPGFEEVTPPSQRLRVVRYNKVNGSPY